METENKKEFKDIPLLEWHLLSIKTLENTLTETKEALKDKIEETQSITDKSIKILIGFVTFISAIGLYYPKHQAPVVVYVIIGCLSFINMGLLFWNIKAHSIEGMGFTPQYLLTVDFDRSDYTEKVKEKIYYKNAIEQYWQGVNKMDNINNSRILFYNLSFLLTILLVLFTSCYLGVLIYYHP